MEKINIDTKLKLKNFSKNISINSKVLQTLILTLSKTEIITVFQLLPFINKDNVIVYNNQPTNIQNISKVIEKKYENVRKIVTTLKEKEILKKVHLSIPYYSKYSSVFVFNPWVYTNSNSIYLEILNIFKDSKWKTVIDNKPDSRDSFEYILWEENVKNRDGYRCVICGESLDLEIHHISPYSIDYENRINVKNGLTLCKKHHNIKIKGSFHQKYGTLGNSYEQLQEYIDNERKNLQLPLITIDEIINKK